MNVFIKHPKSVCMTYTTHCNLSIKLSFLFLKASVQAFIHAIFPFFYAKSSTANTKNIMSILENSGCKQNNNKN